MIRYNQNPEVVEDVYTYIQTFMNQEKYRCDSINKKYNSLRRTKEPFNSDQRVTGNRSEIMQNEGKLFNLSVAHSYHRSRY